jgi:phospho-N-acetylmuramoyl-pentapeptide-transferase
MLTFGRWFTNKMRVWHGRGQPIRSDGPQSHLVKSGTPTMGGILILAAITVSGLAFMDWGNATAWIALAALLGFGLIGFIDDFAKVKRKSSEDKDAIMSPKIRLILEGVLVIVLTYFINKTMPVYIPELSLTIPFVGIFTLGIFYFVWSYFVIVGSTNAANITDGLDGMLAKVIIPVLGVLLVAVFAATHLDFFSGSLFLPSAAGLYPLLGAALGAVLGFLWFNGAPAAIFMGDVGSLALGGFIGTVAMLLKSEIIMGIAALMMVVILLSSLLQKTCFKITKKLTGTGRRIFKMAPLHHHFELSGWAETKISERFFIMSLLFSAIALAIMKLG